MIKLISNDWDRVIYILFLLLLFPSKVDIVLKKKQSNRNMTRTFGSDNDKMVFFLLAKVEIFYMAFIAIYVRRSGFQRLVLRSLKGV